MYLNISLKLKYLLGILNSKLYYVWLYFRGKRKGEMLELYQTPLKEIPVVLSENKMQTMIELIDTMSDETDENKMELLQYDIDRLVYQIYRLDDLEIQWIEKFLLERGLNREFTTIKKNGIS